MPLTWHTRKSRLGSLLNNGGDEEEEALALDRLLHGQSVIGKTCELHICVLLGHHSLADATYSENNRNRRVEVYR